MRSRFPLGDFRGHEIEDIFNQLRVVIAQGGEIFVSQDIPNTDVVQSDPAAVIKDDIGEGQISMNEALPMNVFYCPEKMEEQVSDLIFVKRFIGIDNVA